MSPDGAGPSHSDPMDVEQADGEEGEGQCHTCESDVNDGGDGDALDEAELDATVERNILAPLRARRMHVPHSELSEQQGGGLRMHPHSRAARGV